MKKLLAILVLGLLFFSNAIAMPKWIGKAIKSYQAVQKIYPSIRAAKVMIPQLRKLIKEEAI